MEIILIDLNRLPRSITIGRQFDNAVTALEFEDIELEEGQTAYLLTERRAGPCRDPEVARHAFDEDGRFVVKRPLTNKPGVIRAQLEIKSEDGSAWHSDIFTLEVGLGIRGLHDEEDNWFQSIEERLTALEESRG